MRSVLLLAALSISAMAQQQYGGASWGAQGSGGSTVTITPSALPNATLSVPYSVTLSAGGAAAPYTWALTGGRLPPGIAFDTDTGIISGTPRLQGTYRFTIIATDVNTLSTAAPFTIIVRR